MINRFTRPCSKWVWGEPGIFFIGDTLFLDQGDTRVELRLSFPFLLPASENNPSYSLHQFLPARSQTEIPKQVRNDKRTIAAPYRYAELLSVSDLLLSASSKCIFHPRRRDEVFRWRFTHQSIIIWTSPPPRWGRARARVDKMEIFWGGEILSEHVFSIMDSNLLNISKLCVK